MESKTLNKVDLEQTTFKMKNQKNFSEKNDQEPVVALRGKVSVGEANRVNTESSDVKGQSDEDVRGEGIGESIERPGASTAYETFRFCAYRSQSSCEAGTGTAEM